LPDILSQKEMKSFAYLCGLLALSFTACQKGDSATDPAVTPDPGGNVSAVPTSFTQKVLIEEFTGAGQSQCTDGFVKRDNIVSANPNTAIPVSVHYSDAMEIAQYTTLFTNFNNGSAAMFPSGMLNRTPSLSTVILNRTQWQSNYDVIKTKTAACGLSIKTSVSGTSATIEVHAGFKQSLSGNYNITVYLTENNVKGSGMLYDQKNSYNTSAGHAYFGAGDPILNFTHNNALRKVVSAGMGDAIPSSKLVTGGEEIKTYTVNISAYKLADLYAVAFINKVGTTATTQEIMNVQKVKIGSTQNWD
jgi:hypothetical protein